MFMLWADEASRCRRMQKGACVQKWRGVLSSGDAMSKSAHWDVKCTGMCIERRDSLIETNESNNRLQPVCVHNKDTD